MQHQSWCSTPSSTGAGLGAVRRACRRSCRVVTTVRLLSSACLLATREAASACLLLVCE